MPLAEILRRNSLGIVSGLLIAISCQLMSLSLKRPELPQMGGRALSAVIFPAEKLYHEISESAKYAWTHYLWLLKVESERNQLKERVKELESVNSRYIEFQAENIRLRELLSFSHQTGFKGVAASVVGRDPSNWMKTITIDRGAEDGLRSGLAVVDGNAVVGQVTVVSKNSSKVLLINDTASAIDSIIQSSRATGILEGNGTEKLKLRYVEYADDSLVRVGDRVIASGLDGVFAKGLLLGVVNKVGRSTTGQFQEIEVVAGIDLEKIENIMVVVPEQTEYPRTIRDFLDKNLPPEKSNMTKNLFYCPKFSGGNLW
jgi:rod shape-determining protein MreC